MTMVVQRCVKHIMTSFKKFLFLLLFCSCHTCLRHPITVSPREDWQWILLFLIPISPFFYLFFLSHQPSVFFFSHQPSVFFSSAISHQCRPPRWPPGMSLPAPTFSPRCQPCRKISPRAEKSAPEVDEKSVSQPKNQPDVDVE